MRYTTITHVIIKIYILEEQTINLPKCVFGIIYQSSSITQTK